jgi:hypothetical protein
MLGQIFDTVLTVSGHEVDVIIDVYSLDDEYVDDGYEVSTRQSVDNDDLDYDEVEELANKFRDKYYGRD